MRKWLNWLFPILLVFISSFVIYKNFTPGTWLLGWDNLVPELNFKLNIARSFSAVWQEYQGLGLLGGMAHAADLPRQLVLSGFAVLIPQSLIRYFWTFLMLILGPLGVYFLVSSTLAMTRTDLVKVRPSQVPALTAAFVSAIFYIFNLATLQTFFTPFETFISLFGFLPWFLFLAIGYLKSGEYKYLLYFAIISVLGSSSFYVQTLFVVYVIFLVLLSLEAIIRYKKSGVLRVIKLALVTICINAFWLAPATYFTVTNSKIVQTSHINSIATPETQLMNMARSDFKSVATLKGYWFDYYDWDNLGNYKLMYQDWIDHTQNPLVANILLILFAISLIGLILIWVKPKAVFGLSFTFLFGISFLILSGINLSAIPLFNEAFRNVFTKWSNAFALILSIGVGYFIFLVSNFLQNKFVKIFVLTIFATGIAASSMYSTFPILQGKLISNSMKVNLPSDYFETINYFKTINPTKRIAAFPLTDFWGWQFNDWATLAGGQGYRGSGFLWYGISQPILSRTFDVWSNYNEDFYDEINYAINWGKSDDLKLIFEKYQVSYILFDNSILQIGNPNSSIDLQKQKMILESSGFITKEKQFGQIIIYKADISEPNNFVSAPTFNYSKPLFNWNQKKLVVRENFSVEQGYLTAKNCSLGEKGSVIKEKLTNGNYYKAQNSGVSCDYFYYPTLSYSRAYTLRIVGKNISGRSLKFYLYKVDDQKAMLDEILPTGNFDKTYTILPTGDQKETGGYTLNAETKSFGKIKSENIISNIEFSELSNAKASGPDGPMARRDVYSIQNDLEIKSVKKYGTWGYRVETSGSGLLELGQGYENGWVTFPLLDHQKVNGWANGWTIKNTQINKSTNMQIWIVYWPQLLEWVGMVAGGIILLVIRNKQIDK